VKNRLDSFEQRLAKWSGVDEDISRSLEEIVARQETVGALQADLDRMLQMAEKTTADVRTIAAAHGEIAESREFLKEITARLKEVRDTANNLDERKRQMSKAEERLARAEGLLVDVKSSLEALEGQQGIVDQAVEKTAALQYLLKQAEAVIDGLREERKSSRFVRSAVTAVSNDDTASAEADEEAIYDMDDAEEGEAPARAA
jgi:DNA repair exonuclease SbcCD ATPase subunit